jgi:hypothetical protein
MPMGISSTFGWPRGYRIAAIMLPCQGRDGGPTPPTRSTQAKLGNTKALLKQDALLYYQR